MDEILKYLIAIIPPSVLAAVGYGELRTKVKRNCAEIKRLKDSKLMTEEHHAEICHLHQMNLNTRLSNIENSVAEIKQEIKAGNKERTEARSELMQIVKTAIEKGGN